MRVLTCKVCHVRASSPICPRLCPCFSFFPLLIFMVLFLHRLSCFAIFERRRFGGVEKNRNFLTSCIDRRLCSRLWHNILIALSLAYPTQWCEICDRMTLHCCDGLIEYQYCLQYLIVYPVNLISPERCVSLASCDLFIWPRSETKHRHQSGSPAGSVAWAPVLWSPFYFYFFYPFSTPAVKL